MSSPSAVAKVKGCARKVALDLFEPYEQGAQAALGDEIHEQADDYQKFGKAPDLTTTAGLALEPGLPYMPRPRTGNAEGKVRWTFKGLTHNFRMDLNGLVRDLPMALAGTDPDMPYVLDYKSQTDKGGREKDQQLWGKAAFLADEEAVLYALRRMVETNTGACYLRWLYLRAPEFKDNKWGKHRPKARPSDVIVTLGEVEDAYERMYAPYAKVVDQIYDAKYSGKLNVISAMSLPANPFQCTRYGNKYACPHMDKCNLAPEFVLVETSKEENYTMQLQGNDLFAAMQAAMGQAQAAMGQAQAAPVAPVQTSPIPAVAQASAFVPAPTAAPTMPSAPAFVNPPEAPHVPAASTGPTFTTMRDNASVATPSVTQFMDDGRALGAPTDAEIGRVVRFLFGR